MLNHQPVAKGKAFMALIGSVCETTVNETLIPGPKDSRDGKSSCKIQPTNYLLVGGFGRNIPSFHEGM